jgi:hypothetical protein
MIEYVLGELPIAIRDFETDPAAILHASVAMGLGMP